VLGADVLIPDFQVVAGNEEGVVILIGRTNPNFEIVSGNDVFLRGNLTLDYRSDSNEFLGRLTDLTFASFGSPWVAAMADLFNPSSPDFDPARNLYFTYSPRDNFLNLTQSFTVNGVSGGGDLLFAAPAPEPNAMLLSAAGLLALLVARRSRARCHMRGSPWGGTEVPTTRARS